MSRFAGKVTVVTGGASGIGAATVEALMREGASVVSVDLQPVPLESERLVNVKLDVSDPSAADQAIKSAVRRFGQLDVLINCAGVGALEASETLTPEAWRRTLSINLDGTFYMCQAAIRCMLHSDTGGSIVNVASIHGHVGFGGHAAYTASKAGVINLTRSLAIEYASRGIRVNAVCPGFVKTPMIDAGVSDELMPQVVALHPIGRIGLPEEIASAIMFLASNEASFMIGASMVVDGGYLAQ